MVAPLRSEVAAAPINAVSAVESACEVSGLDRAQRHGLPERGDGIAFGDEFLTDEAAKPSGSDGAANRGIVQLLSVVDLVSTRIACCVVVSDVRVMLLNRPDDVAFHHLHVVDIVEQLQSFRTDAFAKLDAPSRVIALIVGMVDLAVEKLDAERDSEFLGCADELLVAFGAGFQAFFVALAATIAGKADQIGHSGRGAFFQALFDQRYEPGMIFPAIEAVRNGVDGLAHCANQTVRLEDWPVLGTGQLNGFHPEPFDNLGQFGKGNFRNTPAGNGMAE